MTDAVTTLEDELVTLAKHIVVKAKAENCDIQDSVKALKEVTSLYSILTKPPDKGDKEPSRGPTTMGEMRRRIALVSDREDDDDTPA